MKQTYQYIRFASTGKGRWDCLNRKHDDPLGTIYHHGRWRQYVYSPTNQAIYSANCLRDIAEFLEACNAQRDER